MNRNIGMGQPYKMFGIFCGLFLITSIFVKGSTSNAENEKRNSFFLKANQQTTNNIIFQDWESTIPYDFLSILSSGEEVDPTDETTEEKTSESGFPLLISRFYYDFIESSFINFNLSLQKRITIPFFLLHHSWKIPFA
ncbi:hypothetical protein [Emticicia sp. BO119]|uniref:hypothetical protein n=1 Tax=Emticicia sp. BO119 TaxID=2757768 RepID=UPI0015F08C37|nr:hypothetical protein [Emticicia sp. BO119]MBA4850292.1 hypothetical protein [Emticicia sp. BO119]